MPTISVIVPVYNVEKYLRCCVDSILAQTFTDIEVLLVDDGSTDGSGAICDEYAQKDSRVRVFHKANGGVSSARNLGLDEAAGKYFLLCDSDDVIHPQLLSMAVSEIEQNELDCLIYGYSCVDEEITFEEVRKEIRKKETVELMNREQVLREILRGQRFRMLACNKLYRAELWESIRYPVGRKYGDDTSVTYRLMDLCQKVGYVETPYYYYRMRAGSALQSTVSMERLQLFLSYSELLAYYHDMCPQLTGEAHYAYVVRMFDFFAIVNKSEIADKKKCALYDGLRKISVPFWRELCFCHKITLKQRVLLLMFFFSVNVFAILTKGF